MYQIRRSSASEANALHGLMERSAAEAPEGYFVVDSLEFVERHAGVDPAGFSLVAEVEADGALELVAFILVRFPRDEPDNLGRDIELPDAELCAHIESVAVRPDHRGRGLQRMLMEQAEVELRRRGTPHALATVDPDNRWSRQNFERTGYTVRREMEKYGGLRRLILAKDLAPAS